jgi:hypothetical protein
MSLNIRFPIASQNETRDAENIKDMKVKNAFREQTETTTFLVKRPGLENKASALGLAPGTSLGIGQGIFVYEDNIYSFNSTADLEDWQPLIVGPESLLTAATQFGTPDKDKSFRIDKAENLFLEVLPEEPNIKVQTTIGYVGNKFLIARSNGANTIINSSVDGITWTRTALPALSGKLVACVRGNTVLLAQKNLEQVLRSLDGGVTWSGILTTNLPTILTDPIKRIATNNTTIFTIGVWYSLDGITWLISTGQPPTQFNFIHWTGFQFVSTNENLIPSNIYTSSNGIAWSSVSNSAGVRFNIAAQSAQRLIGLNAGTGYSPSTCFYSDNLGTTWTAFTVPNFTDSKFVSLVYFNFKFYLFHYIPATLFSPNPFTLWLLSTSVNGTAWETYSIELALFDKTPTLIAGIL